MNCSLNTVAALILSAIGILGAAIAMAHFWPTVAPLFVAAAFVAAVSFGLIPAIKNALLAYQTCRGRSEKCTISSLINTLGQAASIISFVSFAVAASMQIAALAALASWVLAWLGVAMEVAVAALVYSGMATCGIVMGILVGVLTQSYAYKNCMDRQTGNSA